MITTEYSIGTYYTETTDMHRWFAVEDGQRIGELYVDMEREIIMQIEVNANRRGEGIARMLYEAANAQLASLKHAPVGARTWEGDQFAQAVGGEVAEAMDELDMDWLADEDDEDF